MTVSSSVLLSDKERLTKRRSKEHSSVDVIDGPYLIRKMRREMTTYQQNHVIDWLNAAALTLWTSYIRLWKISQPSSVV
jgi:hypothetical protein